MRILGMDYGKARTGLAISDEGGRIAFPLQVIEGSRDYRRKIEGPIQENGVGRIVLGYPLDMSGQAGETAKKVENIAERLRDWFGLEVVLWDERYTTSQASHAVRKSGGGNRKGMNDMAAATIILQSYLDSINRD